MSEEQPQLSYHGRTAANSELVKSMGKCGPNLDATTYNDQVTCEKLADLRT